MENSLRQKNRFPKKCSYKSRHMIHPFLSSVPADFRFFGLVDHILGGGNPALFYHILR